MNRGDESARQQDGCELISLQTVFLHVTQACNLHCAYCYSSAHRAMPDELTAAEWAAVWPQLIAVRPRKVIFTGGEPLVRTDILDLLRSLRDADSEHRLKRCINSNGHLLTPDLARKLVGLADEVRVSLDGFADRNDVLRGRGNFEAAVRALRVCRDVGFDPKALITVTQNTLPDLEELLIFLVQERIHRLNVHWFRPIGRGTGHDEWCVTASNIKAAMHGAFARLGANVPAVVEDEGNAFQTNCGVGQFLNIMPNGDVFPCHVLSSPEFRCGNVRQRSLSAICRSSGLLGELASLDFRALAQQEPGVADLVKPHTCLGDVYNRQPNRAVWRNSVKGIQ